MARTICPCGSHHPPVRLAPSFVFLRLDSQISLVFQTDSLHQFLFKACPPSGVRGLFIDFFPICPCHSHSHLLIPKFANFLLFPPACVARTICLCGSHHPPVRLAPSFVFLRLDSAFFYLQISFVFQTDSLPQFLFKACPSSGVRGLFIDFFPICPCHSHSHLLIPKFANLLIFPPACVAHTLFCFS